MTLDELTLHYDRFVRRYERKYEKLISREIRKQLLSYTRTQSLDISSEGISKVLTDLHKEVAIGWAKYLKVQKRDRFSDYMYSLLRTYMIMDSSNASEQITQTTIDHIKDLLYQATILNWSLNMLNKEILNLKYIRMRGLLIARTEITYSSNLGSYLYMTNSGQASSKRWVGILDGRIRRDHRILNGQVKSIYEPFSVVNKYGVTVQMNYPGDRSFGAGADQICNCRCFLVYE
jgi:uncharacterized protein with gpF-like domain